MYKNIQLWLSSIVDDYFLLDTISLVTSSEKD